MKKSGMVLPGVLGRFDGHGTGGTAALPGIPRKLAMVLD